MIIFSVKPMSLFSYSSVSTTSFNPFILELEPCVQPRKRVLTEKPHIFVLGKQIHLLIYFFYVSAQISLSSRHSRLTSLK